MSNILHYIFPKRCAVCGCVISHNTFLCDCCENQIEYIKVKCCKRCGLPKKKCECKRYAYHFRGIASPFLNKDAAKDGIYGFKFSKNRDAAEFFAQNIVKQIKERFVNVSFDCVTSVPMHKQRRKETGYDHAEILARAVALEMRLPYKRLLVKTVQNKTQHTLKAAERFSNVKNVYKAKGKMPSCVLLVDDIKTTGATLDECSRRLMLAGCDDVYCATAVIGT